ncbi:MAG TPA: hypothetical protein PLP92_17385, partial [Rhodocyclaceae bacterium]|nr:hypothetical protein [Rhodocyclaceae bacterium]
MPADSPLEAAGNAFRALRRSLLRSRGFAVLVCACDSLSNRDELIADLAASLPAVTLHRVDAGDGDCDLLARIVQEFADAPPGPVMILGLERVLADTQAAERMLAALNLSRAEWPTRIAQPVVFWLPRRYLGRLTAGAPDFFDWRSDTLDFPELSAVQLRPFGQREWTFGGDPRLSRAEREERIRELRARISALMAASIPSDDTHTLTLRAAWWDEIADL